MTQKLPCCCIRLHEIIETLIVCYWACLLISHIITSEWVRFTLHQQYHHKWNDSVRNTVLVICLYVLGTNHCGKQTTVNKSTKIGERKTHPKSGNKALTNELCATISYSQSNSLFKPCLMSKRLTSGDRLSVCHTDVSQGTSTWQ